MLSCLNPSDYFHFLILSSFSSSIFSRFSVSSLLYTELVSELPRSSSNEDSSGLLISRIDSCFIRVFGIGISANMLFGAFFENLRPYDIDLTEQLLCNPVPYFFMFGVLRDKSALLPLPK